MTESERWHTIELALDQLETSCCDGENNNDKVGKVDQQVVFERNERATSGEI